MSEVKFRSAFNGFNRSDVVSFITSQNEKFKDESASKDAQLAELQKKAEDAEKELYDYKESVKGLEDKSKRELQICREILFALRDSRAYTEELKALSGITDELVGELCRGYMSKSMELFDAEKYREKAKKYDMITGLLTNGEISAGSNDKMISKNESAIENEMLSGVDMKGYDIKSLSSRQNELLNKLIAALSEADAKIEETND